MPEEAKNDILKELTNHINDLVLKSHSSKNQEVSDLIADLRKDFKTVITDINILRQDFASLDRSLQAVESRLSNEMKLKHQEIDFKFAGQEKRLSFTEKVIFTISGTVGLAFLGAIIKLVII